MLLYILVSVWFVDSLLIWFTNIYHVFHQAYFCFNDTTIIVLKPQERKLNFDDPFALHDMSLECI